MSLLALLVAASLAARAETPEPREVLPAHEAPPPEDQPWSLDLTVHDVGIGIGNSKHIDGLRLNFRDVAPFTVHGINVTVWTPAEHEKGSFSGDVTGLALGLPATGAGTLRGVGLGFGVAVEKTLDGVGIGGLGIGAGGGIEGVAVAGLGVGSPRIRGLVAALAAGGQDVEGVAIAPAYFYINESGRFTGVSLSAFNRIEGEQYGLVIGIINYTPHLHGVQLGLINWAGNNPSGLKLLPIANAHFD